MKKPNNHNFRWVFRFCAWGVKMNFFSLLSLSDINRVSIKGKVVHLYAPYKTFIVVNSSIRSLTHTDPIRWLFHEMANANTVKPKWACGIRSLLSLSLGLSFYHHYRGQYDGLWSSNQIIIAIIGLFDHLPPPTRRSKNISWYRNIFKFENKCFFETMVCIFCLLQLSGCALCARACWFTSVVSPK